MLIYFYLPGGRFNYMRYSSSDDGQSTDLFISLPHSQTDHYGKHLAFNVPVSRSKAGCGSGKSGLVPAWSVVPAHLASTSRQGAVPGPRRCGTALDRLVTAALFAVSRESMKPSVESWGRAESGGIHWSLVNTHFSRATCLGEENHVCCTDGSEPRVIKVDDLPPPSLDVELGSATSEKCYGSLQQVVYLVSPCFPCPNPRFILFAADIILPARILCFTAPLRPGLLGSVVLTRGWQAIARTDNSGLIRGYCHHHVGSHVKRVMGVTLSRD
ncbi:hypothetical protein RRG08_038289 [Elysia crispata]|uniref:Uncharacterized protein n=1 Tax=Elysia crispata TaxID=231223 RepID=A0AAE1E2U4_9GAST|nr:hypothetical protein RRG08_038289 [Elysia crispata]